MRVAAVATTAVVAALLLAMAGAAADGVQPEQLHLAFAGTDSTTFAVSWFTFNDTATHVVRYGTASGQYAYADTGSSVSYFPASYTHTVVLTQLGPGKAVAPGTPLYYVVGDTTTGVFSDEFTCVSPPAPANPSRPFSVAMFGDMGISNSNATIGALIAHDKAVDFAYHIGDYSYADDRFLEPQLYESIWNTWANSVEPVASAMAYMTLPGNHEAACHSFGAFLCDVRHNNFSAYRHRFRMPSAESGGVESMWYSFSYGMAHFVALSTETDFPSAPEGVGSLWNAGPFGDQLAWLKADLEAANTPAARAQYPWIVVVGHRPVYTTSKNDFPFFAVENLRSHIEPLLLANNVDVYMSGHVHAYERNWPVCSGGAVPAQTYVNPTCPVYLVNGAAGNMEGHSPFTPPQPYTAYRNNADYGFGVLTFVNASVLQWEFVRAADNGVDDSITIVKDH